MSDLYRSYFYQNKKQNNHQQTDFKISLENHDSNIIYENLKLKFENLKLKFENLTLQNNIPIEVVSHPIYVTTENQPKVDFK